MLSNFMGSCLATKALHTEMNKVDKNVAMGETSSARTTGLVDSDLIVELWEIINC
jgi:hypothetical protein